EETPAAAGAEGTSRTTGTAKILGVVAREVGVMRRVMGGTGEDVLKRFIDAIGTRGCCLVSRSAEGRTPWISAEGDADQARRPADQLRVPEGIPERERAGGGADERLQVQERPREL